jgi:hypothetical protein
MRLRRDVAATLLLMAWSASACRPPKEAANLAQAGATYAAAIDSLLLATTAIEIDTTSEKLLQDDALSNQTLEQYRKLSDEDEALLRVIAQLRVHVRLLSQYFELLLQLATSDAPDRIKTGIGDDKSGLIANLNKVGADLRSSNVVAAAAGPAAKLVVGGLIRGALAEELDARKETIQKELLLQEQLLRALADRITHDLEVSKETREERLVIGPLTAETRIANPDGWIASRRSVLTMKLTVEQLGAASGAVQSLRQAFEDFVSGKLTLDRVDSLVTDLNALLSVAEALRKQ